MSNKSVILSVAGLAILAGLMVLDLQNIFPDTAATQEGISSGIDKGGTIAKNRSGTSSSMPSRHERVADDVSIQNLLDRLVVCSDGGENFDRESFDALLVKLLRLDPEAAGRFAESLRAGYIREEALRRVAQGIASSSPERAETWASRLADVTERTSALGDVCLQIAQTDAGEAVRRATHHQLDAAPGELLENLAQQWAGQNLPAATHWILARPAGGQREQMCGRLAIVQAATDPENAARLVLDEIPEGQNQTEAVIAVLYQWASRDMAGATAWVQLFPAGPVRQRAESELSNLAAYQIKNDR